MFLFFFSVPPPPQGDRKCLSENGLFHSDSESVFPLDSGGCQTSDWSVAPCPPPSLSVFPVGEHVKWGCDTPPPLHRGISAILARYHMKTRRKGYNTPLCDTISKRYCAIRGGISYWAAKGPKLSTPDMTGRPGCRTIEMNGGSSGSYLASTLCVPLLCTLFNRGGKRRTFRRPGEGGDHLHCTAEPSPGHIRCRKSTPKVHPKQEQKIQPKQNSFGQALETLEKQAFGYGHP